MLYTYQCCKCQGERIVSHDKEELLEKSESLVSEITCCEQEMSVQIWGGIENHLSEMNSVFLKFSSADMETKHRILKSRHDKYQKSKIEPYKKHVLNNLSNGVWTQ